MKKENGYEKFGKEERRSFFVQTVAGVVLGIVVAVLVAAFSVCLGGCSTTTRIGTDPGAIRDSYSYIAGGLESAVSEFDRGIARAEAHSRGIQDEIERVIYLFNEYEREALYLRNEVSRLRAKIKATEEMASDRNAFSSSVHTSKNGDFDSEGKGN
jgi:hypothetical protein